MSRHQSPGNASQDAAAESGKGRFGTRLLRSMSLVSGMTLLSRILGLVRDIVFARFFGATFVMDAFIVANRIPNMMRRFFAEGAFSQGFVPVIAQYKETQDGEETRELIDSVAGTLGLALFVATLIGVIAAPLLVLVVAPGFIGDGGDIDLAAAMLRFTFPYLMFISLTAFAGGILNTYGKFGAPAFTPVILNVVLIAFALWVSPRLPEPGMALAYGVFVAGIVQLLFQIPFLSKIHAVPRPKWRPRHAGVRRIGTLMLPAIFGSSVAQINVLIGGIIASLLGAGKISYLYYSDRLMEFPLGLFGIALATVMLPTLSKQAANRQMDAFSNTLDWSMRLVMLIAVPAAIGLIVLAEPLLVTLFYGGIFSAFDVAMAGVSLQAFAIGLVGFSFVKILAPAYFARQDTRTPVRYAIIAMSVNLLLSVFLAWYLTFTGYLATHAGLALATSVAAIINAWLLYNGLRQANILVPDSGWRMFSLRLLVANSFMAVCLIALDRPVEWWIEANMIARSTQLCAAIAAAAGVYFVALLLLGLRPAQFRLRESDADQ